jgi:hypothetical protein
MKAMTMMIKWLGTFFVVLAFVVACIVLIALWKGTL